LNENSKEDIVSAVTPSDDKNTENNSVMSAAETTTSTLNLVTEKQNVAKRNPETELLKKLLSYKRKNRVFYVNRKMKCLLAGMPGC